MSILVLTGISLAKPARCQDTNMLSVLSVNTNRLSRVLTNKSNDICKLLLS